MYCDLDAHRIDPTSPALKASVQSENAAHNTVDGHSAIDGHDGRCNFCGTAVGRNFITCTGCGATWRRVYSPFSSLLVMSSWFLGLCIGVLAAGVTRSLETGVMVFFTITIGFVVWGCSLHRQAWVR